MEDKLANLITFVFRKSPVCQHQCSCIEAICDSTKRSFKYAYMLKTTFSLLGYLMALQKSKKLDLKQLLSVFANKNNFKFCMFLTSYTFFSKFILCLLMRIYKNDRKQYAFISGFISAVFAMMILPKENRKMWALYMIVRAFDAQFHKLHQNQYSFVIILAIMQFFTGYAYFYEEDCFGEEQKKTYAKFQNFSVRETQYRDLTNLSKFAK